MACLLLVPVDQARAASASFAVTIESVEDVVFYKYSSPQVHSGIKALDDVTISWPASAEPAPPGGDILDTVTTVRLVLYPWDDPVEREYLRMCHQQALLAQHRPERYRVKFWFNLPNGQQWTDWIAFIGGGNNVMEIDISGLRISCQLLSKD